MRTIYIVLITIACTIVGLFAVAMTASWIISHNSQVYDEMSRECHEKYYDDTKGQFQQEKEFNDCIDGISEFMI